ncbi:MAG TPA: hypothetical protein VGE99_09355 [Candidatus Dormibacteraeota bacterium]
MIQKRVERIGVSMLGRFGGGFWAGGEGGWPGFAGGGFCAIT